MMIRMAKLAALAMLLSGTAVAQVSEDGMGKVLPVELYICSYVDDKGPKDLDKVVARWNAYMDENDIDNYLGMTLTPFFYGMEQEFDLLWMGVFSDGNAMGSGFQNYMTTGQSIQAGFNSVVDCGAHVLLSSAQYKAPTQSLPGGDGVVLSVMDCKLNEGHEYPEVRSAELKWAEHLEEAGSPVGFWHWFPVFGGGDAEFDYKVAYGFADLEQLGAMFEHNANGGGREASREIFGDIDECDDARVYIGQVRRQAQVR